MEPAMMEHDADLKSAPPSRAGSVVVLASRAEAPSFHALSCERTARHQMHFVFLYAFFKEKSFRDAVLNAARPPTTVVQQSPSGRDRMDCADLYSAKPGLLNRRQIFRSQL